MTITQALGIVLLFSMMACQREETAIRGPSPVLSTDTDLGHGYVRRDGAIHFIGGGITGTGANATRIDTPSPALLRKVVRSQFGPFKTAEGLDTGSFEALSEEYTRDKNRVYYINAVVLLTDSQKQQALAALMKHAPAKVEQEADARAFMTLNYGQMLIDVDSSSIRGLANMVSAGLDSEMPDVNIDSSQYQQWTQANKAERIASELSALQKILDEKQLARYREHLEAEPAW